VRTLSSEPLIELHDDVLPEALQTRMQEYLLNAAWQFGSLSSGNSKAYPYWYRNFGGFNTGNADDCAAEVAKDAPIIADVWEHLASVATGQKLIRCYANGYPYGTEGHPHIDSNNPDDRTVMVYANHVWDCSWAGETVFLTKDKEVLAAVLPRSNRSVVFQGNIPHVARAISRVCPLLRITLMFKTANR
jgi:SM-20-related protein